MKEEKPSPQVCDLFLTGAGARAEHYEIAAYTGLINMAESMGENEAVPLLQQNLKQERQRWRSSKRRQSACSARTPQWPGSDQAGRIIDREVSWWVKPELA